MCSIAYILTSCGMGWEVWQRLVSPLLLYIHVHVGNGNEDQLSVDELTAHAVNQNTDEQG